MRGDGRWKYFKNYEFLSSLMGVLLGRQNYVNILNVSGKTVIGVKWSSTLETLPGSQ